MECDRGESREGADDNKGRSGPASRHFFSFQDAVQKPAYQQAGGTDYDKVTEALRTKDVDTTLGKIKFDERGDAIGVGFSMYQVKDGVYVELK